jgi:FkbH-like protein
MALTWLPAREDWDDVFQSTRQLPSAQLVAVLQDLAASQMDFVQLGKLDRALQKVIAASSHGLQPIRLAILGSATLSHLPAGIRVAGLRRGFAIDIYEAPYGMYWQELMDRSSGLYAFQPEAILLALDARHLAAAEGSTADAALDLMRACWRQAKASFNCQVIQQTVLPVFPALMGNNESRLTQSPASIVARTNHLLRSASEEEHVDLLALDAFAAVDGLKAWYEPGIWHRSKHEVHPSATEYYGDQAVRLVAAARGRSAKCLVLDLDNTLWGGVIGDDGLEGIVLGQGSGTGEAFTEFQRYAKGLAERGVILAVCSKNDEINARQPFLSHPDMVLRCADIASFVANWTDKATNLRAIAKTLNIGLDSMVFVDDNPVERALIRRELPMVAVPELPDDPALFAQTIAAAGYFEGLCVTKEDRTRAELYQANAERERLKDNVTDMASYLDSLRMVMTAQPFDSVGLARVTQLINKTNQFNLMTERLTEDEVASRMRDPQRITMQVRLVDRFGDNGVVAVLIARVNGTDAVIETWLMSCRVLGRRVEEACLNVLAQRCAELGAERLIGLYRPTEKNGMVREMYRSLGFTLLLEDASGQSRWCLPLSGFVSRAVPMQVDAVVAEALVS